MNEKNYRISRVKRTKAQAKKSYDRISKYYDRIAGVFEKKYRNKALRWLNIRKGEIVLEIGFGTGHALKKISESVGENGQVYGIDFSSEMLNISKRRLEKAGHSDKVELYCGDALEMPYGDNKFDVVFMSFTLELFDTPEIPQVLRKIKRVMKTNGRFGLVSLTKEYNSSVIIKLYEWIHKKLPRYVDCRPIYVEQSLKESGFKIKYREKVRLFGIPAEIAVCGHGLQG